METTVTRKGWTITLTNKCNGMLEQGGRLGMKRFYSTALLAEIGIKGAPEDAWNDHYTNERYLWEAITPTRVLSRGQLIQ